MILPLTRALSQGVAVAFASHFFKVGFQFGLAVLAFFCWVINQDLGAGVKT